MRDPARLDGFYEKFKELHKEKLPDWRFGQLMCNLLDFAKFSGRDPFFFEENEMLEYFMKFLNTGG